MSTMNKANPLGTVSDSKIVSTLSWRLGPDRFHSSLLPTGLPRTIVSRDPSGLFRSDSVFASTVLVILQLFVCTASKALKVLSSLYICAHWDWPNLDVSMKMTNHPIKAGFRIFASTKTFCNLSATLLSEQGGKTASERDSTWMLTLSWFATTISLRSNSRAAVNGRNGCLFFGCVFSFRCLYPTGFLFWISYQDFLDLKIFANGLKFFRKILKRL